MNVVESENGFICLRTPVTLFDEESVACLKFEQKKHFSPYFFSSSARQMIQIDSIV